MDAISIRQLRSFAFVAQYKSFSVAADALNVTQPAITQHVKYLEDYLGVRLFNRNPRNVTLTQQGIQFLDSVELLLRDFDMMVEGARAMVEYRTGTVRIASPSSMAQMLMVPIIERLRRSHPGLAIVITEVDDTSVEEYVRNGQVEFALTGVPTTAPDLEFQELFRDRACIVFPHGHEFEAREEVDAACLEGREFVRAPRSTISENFAVRFLTDAMIKVRTVCEVGQLMSAATMVERGVGLTILPALSCAAIDRFQLGWKPIARPTLWRTCGILSARNRIPSPGGMLLRSNLDVQVPRLVSDFGGDVQTALRLIEMIGEHEDLVNQHGD